MKGAVKEEIQLKARVVRLQEARRGLFRRWFRLDSLRGLDGLTEAVEEAYDEVSEAGRSPSEKRRERCRRTANGPRSST